MAHEDLFEFFLKIIQKNLRLGPKESHFHDVKVDEDQFSLEFAFLGDFGKVHLAIDLFTTDQPGVTAVNFRKTKGCVFKYQKGVDAFRKNWIYPIWEVVDAE